MNTPLIPKSLPWLASRAQVSLPRATELWQQARRDAAFQSHAIGTAEFWQMAMARLNSLLAEERAYADAATLGWRLWARNQRAWWDFRLRLIDACALTAERNLRLFNYTRASSRLALD